jgi:Iron/zinc purple acid phosphatase-like protein C
VLYSNALEDPGVIADSDVGNTQLTFLRAALTRLKKSNYQGALLFAHHHPPYTLSRHGWSIEMQAQIDQVCQDVGLWPHADLSGHAHNYQRFTRHRADGTAIPYVVCGNGGHNVQRLSKTAGTVIRAPQIVQQASAATASTPAADQIVFENYDDGDYGYLRVIANATQLRIEYHPAADGSAAKAPNDFVTVDLKTRALVPYNAPALGLPQAAAATAASAAKAQQAQKAQQPRAAAQQTTTRKTRKTRKKKA